MGRGFFAYSDRMPWRISEQNGRYCVVNKDTGKTEKCHATKKEAKDHMAALYANEPKAGIDLPCAIHTWETEMDHLFAMYDESFPFGRAKARITAVDGSVREFDCALADTDETRARGMVGRGFDGFEAMLFAYDQPVQYAFHMNGVPVQLYIAWYDSDGTIVDHLSMFVTDPAQYQPKAAYRWAIELPVADDMSWLDDSTLQVD